MSDLHILDVGHGNCSVLVDGECVVFFDAGTQTTLLEFLRQEGIRRIDVLLISHADADHLRGLAAILAVGDIEIGTIRLNADASKGTQLWDDVLYAVNVLHKTTKLDAQTALTTANSREFDCGEVQIEVLAPSLYIAGKSAGSVDREGRRLTSNSNSAVFKLSVNDCPIVLLPGDLDQTGLSNLLEDGQDISARIVVFPHHGGLPSTADPIAFTEDFCRLSSPAAVVFSNGRGRFGTPRPDIIQTIRSVLPEVRIVCTELSENCCENLPNTVSDHLSDKFAQGRIGNRCCGGTVTIGMTPDGNFISPDQGHREFVQIIGSTALCLK